MPGITKRKYNGELVRFKKSLKQPLNKLKGILPREYSSETIVSEFRTYYPLIWQEMQERYNSYRAKDEFLTKNGKPLRYNPKAPATYLLNLPQVKLWLSEGGIKNHKHIFSEKSRQENIMSLSQKRDKSILKYENKVNVKKRKIQNIEQLYIDIFIESYHKKQICHDEKIEIFNELKKYESKKVIEFFHKLNDSEKNNQIRKFAFDHLQSLGKYVRLRKKFKGKQKNYMIEFSKFDMKPKDLWERIEANKVQNKKRFDFFISHSYANKDEVLKVLKLLNKQGYVVYCDWTSDNDFLKRGFVSEYTKMVLKKRLEQSSNILLLKSDKALASEWVAFELEYFTMRRKPIYFIELDTTIDSRLDKYKMLTFNFDKAYLQNPNELRTV